MKAVKGKKGYYPDFESSEEAESYLASNSGLCTQCGRFTEGVEPDARGYTCDICGRNAVFGLDEMMVHGMFLSKALPTKTSTVNINTGSRR